MCIPFHPFRKIKSTTCFLAFGLLLAVLPGPGSAQERGAPSSSSLREALTFHASFDEGVSATFAKGDPALYSVTATKPETRIEPGLHAAADKLAHEKDGGRFGGFLDFKAADAPRVFFEAEENLAFAGEDWQGTVSFWLRTTPDEDLEPGYTDPIQITPRSALDACFFFEFGIEDPRPCRLGVFPDRLAWNPEDKPNNEIPIPDRPLIEVQKPPFSRDHWTHVVFTFEKFNNGDQAGVARLYLNGEPRGGELTGWKQQYTWDLAQTQIRLGVKFIGGFDELSCFNRALTPEEIKGLHSLETGVTSLLAAGSPTPECQPLFQTVDLDIGETVEVSGAKVKLVSVREPEGEVWGEIGRPEVTVDIDGAEHTLVSGMYRLPVTAGKVQIDCPVTGGLMAKSHIDHWVLEKDARLRIWPAASPWIAPGTFGYPVIQEWFASQTAFSNEPVSLFPGSGIYYHAGLDIGGCEGLTEVVSATDALVVSVGNRILPGHEPAADTPVKARYDVLYLLDDRGWYYRYSHLHSFDPALRPGMRVKLGDRLGLLGKEGGSGGWSHLHFEIKSRKPSGRWGTEDGYAFLWQGYREVYDPDLIAIARPGHVILQGDTITHDGSRSWSREGEIASYEWQFSDGTTASGPAAEFSYERPGTLIETLRVTDAAGRSDHDFVRVKVFGRDDTGAVIDPPRLHATFHPTFDIRAGDPVTFKVRAFNTTHGEEVWNFGDGSPEVRTKSDGNVQKLAKDGYATLEHVFEKPGDYLVHVRRINEHGHVAEDRLHVRVGD